MPTFFDNSDARWPSRTIRRPADSRTFHTWHLSPFPTLAEVQPDILREFNRARRFEHEVSVAVLHADGPKQDLLEVMDELVTVGLRETDIWAYEPDQQSIIAVAPETNCDDVLQMLRRVTSGLQRASSFDCTCATFPEDGLTFEVLLEECEQRRKQPALPRQAASRLSMAERRSGSNAL